MRRMIERALAKVAGVMFGQACRIPCAARAERTSAISRISLLEMGRTIAPRFGTNSTSPSDASVCSASRNGITLHPSEAASSSWRSFTPAG